MQELIKEVQVCTVCRSYLPLEPRPILSVGENAKVMIIGQAPGTKAHETRTPWNDQSGNRLREWMNIDRKTFYDTNRLFLQTCRQIDLQR